MERLEGEPMGLRCFESLPRKIVVVEFLGEPIASCEWLNVKGLVLKPEDRIATFWNRLHDTELEVGYGDFVVCHDKDDLYPIKKEVLFRNYREW